MERAKKVGIVSEIAHAKPLVMVLEREGYEPLSLGGNPKSLPPSLDAIVCRVKSCSHEASHLAFTANREQGVPLIVHNGVTAIVRELRNLFAAKTTKEETEMNATLENDIKESKNCKRSLANLFTMGGFYAPKLADFTPSQLADVAMEMGLIQGAKARARTHMAFEEVFRYTEATQTRTYRELLRHAEEQNLSVTTLHFIGKNNVPHTFGLLSKVPLNAEKVQVLARKTGFLLEIPDRIEALGPMVDGEYRGPYRSKNFRGYWVNSDRRWRITDARSEYLMQVRTRQEMIAKIDQMEAEKLAEAAIESMVTEAAALAEVVVPTVVEPPSITPEVEVDLPTPEEELEATLRHLRGLMNKLGRRMITFEGLKAHVLATHLVAPKDKGCGQVLDGEVSTRDISQVTCEHCKTTEFYGMAEFALLTLTIG